MTSDDQVRHELHQHLVALRHQGGFSRADVAERLDRTPQAVSMWERTPPAKSLVRTYQAYARAVGHRLTLTPVGFVAMPPTPEVAVLLGLEASSSGAEQDRCHVRVVTAQLVALRRWSGRTCKEFGRVFDRSDKAVWKFETGDDDPYLATLQRYTRALGGSLGFDLQCLYERAV